MQSDRAADAPPPPFRAAGTGAGHNALASARALWIVGEAAR